MRFLGTILAICISVLLLSGCHRSGKWVDDPGNWNRAFGRPQPKELQIVHSVYWQTPHFTRDKSPPSLYKKWLGAYKVRHPDSVELQRLESFKKDRPSWFLPKPMAEYEIWVVDEPYSSFALFVDQTTGEWFVTDGG